MSLPNKHSLFCRGVLRAALVALGLGLAVPATRAADADGAPLWVSLRNSETNMRVGPGRDYRINWTYKRPGLPMKVLRSMEGWVLVEDPDGARGWMLTQFVTHKTHTVVVRSDVAEIRENRDGSGHVMWRAQRGVIARLLGECSGGWCKVDIDGRQGFMAATSLWGAGTP